MKEEYVFAGIIPEEEIVRDLRKYALQRTCRNCKFLKKIELIVEMRHFRVKDKQTGKYRMSKTRRREGPGDIYVCQLGKEYREYLTVEGERINEVPDNCPYFQANKEYVERQLRDIGEYEKLPSIWESIKNFR